MAYYYSIPIEEMEEELESLRFYPVNLVFRNKPVKEWVYERKLPRSPNHFVRIYTGIQRYGQSAGESRKAGKDAIRIQVIYRDAKGETLVSQTKRVHRVGGWRKNLHKRMNEVSSELPQVEFDSRGEPMTLRKKGNNQFWGSRDYPKYKETKPFRAESEAEWGGLPVHEINSLEELIDIFESRDYDDSGNLKRKEKAYTNYELMTNSLFKINFSGIYGVRTIFGPSKVIYGVNLLQSNKINKGSQLGGPTILSQTYVGADVVSVEIPFIPTANLPYSRSNESKLEDLIEIMKQHGGLDSSNPRAKTKNTMIFDMKDVVFAADLPAAGWDIMRAGISEDELKLLKKRGWRALHFAPKKTQLYGEIEILGGIPQENIVYEEIPPVALNPLEVDIETRNWSLQRTGRMEDVVGDDFRTPNRFGKMPTYKYGGMTDEEYVAHWNKFAAESPEWDDIDWETDKPPKEHEDWGDDVEWDAESYLERDSRIRRELDEGLLRAGRDMPMQKYEYRRIKKFNTPEELDKYGKSIQNSRSKMNWKNPPAEHENHVFVCDFDWYVKRVTNNPIYTLYGHIIPLSNFSSGWSDQIRRDDKLVKRYGAPIFVQSPMMGKIMTTLKDVRKISDEKMGQSNSPMVGHGMKGLKMKINPDEDSVLIINMKGLKFAYGKGYFSEFSDIMILGGLPVKNVVGHRYKKPEYRALNEQRHWKVKMEREDFARSLDRKYGRYSAYDNAYRDRFDKRISQYNRGFGSEDEEITMREFDDTTADDFVKDSDDQITLMLRKKSKINKYGDIGCPSCGSIGLFSGEIIAKGKKWYCFDCLYEDKTETIKSRGDITLEKYGLVITCPICKKGIKAYNNDSMLRHMKKCGE